MTEIDKRGQENELIIPDGTSFHLVPDIGEIETTGMNTGNLKFPFLTAEEQVAKLTQYREKIKAAGGEVVNLVGITGMVVLRGGGESGVKPEQRLVAIVNKGQTQAGK